MPIRPNNAFHCVPVLGTVRYSYEGTLVLRKPSRSTGIEKLTAKPFFLLTGRWEGHILEAAAAVSLLLLRVISAVNQPRHSERGLPHERVIISVV